MYISKIIPIDVDLILKEIEIRQGSPWNNGRINDYGRFDNLKKLYYNYIYEKQSPVYP